MKRIFQFTGLALILFNSITNILAQQPQNKPHLLPYPPMGSQIRDTISVDSVQPLDRLMIIGAGARSAYVTDGKNRKYFEASLKPNADFVVGGSLGKHTVYLIDKNGNRMPAFNFVVTAKTNINDGGYYKEMFDLIYKSMWDTPGKIGNITWNGKLYHYFVPWGLDHCHTMKGLKYFNGKGAEFVDLCREAQREDGMIWSFIQYMPNPDYYLTRDKHTGYSKKIGDKVFVRQPTENHPEYIFVNTIYQCWKASGDKQWMKKNLSSAARALEYTINDPARWSKRYGLLKRVYTIDSWDFQVEDEYLPDLGITNSMILDTVRSKFGIFFGDNTGYITACYELAEMFEHDGQMTQASKYRQRANELKDRLDKLAWNGRFYTHFIEEDSTVKRNLGVDEKSQLAQSNAYSLNRNIDSSQKKSIIKEYLNLKGNLPPGSPGEWYAIYPPFQKGFTIHNEVWQYMNGGVGGHVAGELARGSFENGYEQYGVDILNRLFELGKKYNNKIYFAYTGATSPPPPSPHFKPLNLTPYANMDFWNKGSRDAKPWMLVKRKGDDFQHLPVGDQTFQNIRFHVIDPEKNNRKSVVAVSHLNGFPPSIEIPVNDTAGSVYLLHTSTKPSSENVVGTMIFVYADGTRRVNYIINGKHLTYWWFSELKTDHSGIAWYGKNDISEGIGLSWCAIDNPHPGKVITKIILESPADNGIYSVFGITLSNQAHYVPVNPVSFGGPDNWAAATAMAAMVEGLAGVKDAPNTEAFSRPVIAPRWINTKSNDVFVSIRYEASHAYASYRYKHIPHKRQMQILTTGSGNEAKFHIQLPDKIQTARSVMAMKKSVPFTTTKIEHTNYIDFTVDHITPVSIVISY